MDRSIVRRLYRYLLEHEVDGSDVEQLIDSLPDESFPIREELGEAELNRRIKEGVLLFDQTSEARLPWFGGCLEVLSIYLSEYIIGIEVEEGWNAEGTRIHVAITKHVARRGELIAVPLQHKIEFPSGEISAGLEDLGWLEAHFASLPRWAQDAYRLKFPELRRL